MERGGSTWKSVLAAMAVGAVLRLWWLDREGLWLDELFTARVITRESWAGLLDELKGDVHPPLYFALLRLWSGLFGTGDVALRVPSALAGVAAIPLTARLADSLFGRLAAAPAAWLLALAPFAVALDREARGNALFGLLAVAASVVLVRGGSDRRAPVLYAGLAAMLLYTHVFGAFVLLAHAAWFMAEAAFPDPAVPAGDARPVRPWVAAAFAAGLAWLPWVGVLSQQTRVFAASPWYSAPSADGVGWLGLSLASEAPGLAFALGAAAVIGVWQAADGRAARLLLAALLGLILVPQLISYAVAPVLRDRNVYPLLALVLTAAGAGLASARSRHTAAAGLVALVGMEGMLTGRALLGPPHGEQWREAAALVASGWAPGDHVLANQPQLWRHYLPDDIVPEPASVDAIRTARGPAWLLLAHDEEPGLVAAFEQRGTLLSDTALRGARVLHADPLTIRVALGADQPPPLFDAGHLHFYWDAALRSEALAPTGLCAVGVLAHGEAAGGEPARLALRVLQDGTIVGESLVDLAVAPTMAWGTPIAVATPAQIEVAFVNDARDANGADRNAHVDEVLWRCDPA